jgi:hypothetical protein
MDGRPAGPYRQYPFPYLGQFMGGFGYLPPFGDYVHSQRYGYNPDIFSRGGYPRDRSSRVLIVVEPTDVPGATYYYNAFPYYYGDPGYFAGNAYGDQYVTIVSPTVPQAQQAPQEQQAEQPQAAQVRVPAELARAAFTSALSPMLGGDARVSVDFSVGELKLRRGDYAGAAGAFGRAVGTAPDETAPKLALGLAMLGTGDYEGAVQVVKRGLRGMSDWRNLKFRPAAAFPSDAAYQQVRAPLQQSPSSDKDAQFLLGVLSLATGNNADAINHLALAGLDDPLVIGLLVEAERRDEAAGKAAGPAPAAPGK